MFFYFSLFNIFYVYLIWTDGDEQVNLLHLCGVVTVVVQMYLFVLTLNIFFIFNIISHEYAFVSFHCIIHLFFFFSVSKTDVKYFTIIKLSSLSSPLHMYMYV